MKLLALVFALPFLLAFTFNPMSQSIELGSNQKSAQFLLENDSNEKMAIELSVKVRKMDETGKESLEDTSDMAVFPPQLIIPAKEKRTIRVNWNGAKELDVEKAFRVIAEQLPLNVDEKTKKRSGIQMLMKYVAALYVTPKDAKSEMKILETDLKNSQFTITLENSGNKHQILANPEITFKDENNKTVLKADSLKGLAGENVLAKSKRTFIIKSDLKARPQGTGSIKLDE